MTTEELFIKPDWPAPDNVRAFVTLRESKVADYNLQKKINSPRLKDLLKLPKEPIWIQQTHSDIALKATSENSNREADASYTDEPNQVCAILTADCLPILICDKQGKHVAAIHAGWKGLAKGVIENTVRALNLNPSDLLIWLGPAISQKNFTVREDVFDAFTINDHSAENCFQKINSEQWLADLYGLATHRLKKIGISEIYGGNFCTYNEEDKFFSYRRQGKILGHMVSVIWLAD